MVRVTQTNVKSYAIPRKGKGRKKKYADESRAAAMSTAMSSSKSYSIEKKYLDTLITSAAFFIEQDRGQAFTSTSSAFLLNSIAAGDDDFNRQGRLVNLISISIRGSIQIPQGAASTLSTNCRWVIVHDRQSSLITGAPVAPLWGDVFTEASVAGVAGNVSSVSQLNLNGRERFQVLAEENVCLGDNLNTAPASNTTFFIKRHVNLKGLVANYASTSAAIPIVGALWLVCLGDVVLTGSGAQNYAFYGNARLRFKDP